MRVIWLLLILALGWSMAPAMAHAQLRVTPSPAGAPVLGNTIRGSSATVFSISTTGGVTRVSGDAIRLGPGVVTAPTVTIDCGFLNLSSLCALRSVRVTITPVTGSSAAHITRFRVASVSGMSYRSGSAPAEASSLSFDINPIGLFGSAVFRLGMDIRLDANAPSGNQPVSYIVTAQFI